jgi:hypothetical protein
LGSVASVAEPPFLLKGEPVFYEVFVAAVVGSLLGSLLGLLVGVFWLLTLLATATKEDEDGGRSHSPRG